MMQEAPPRRTTPAGPVAAQAAKGVGRKLLLSLAIVGTAASIAGLGTFATFTSTTNGSQDVSSGTVVIALGADGADNRLSVSASNVAPGDSIQRAVKLTNSGTIDLASVTLTTAATTSSLLNTDATNGIQMQIDKCSVAWVESATPYTYTCADVGGATSVLASRPWVGDTLALSDLSSTTAGGADNLLVTLTLPTTADNNFQNLSSTVSYTFTGTQRAGTDK